MNDSKVSSGTIIGSLNEQEKREVISKQHDPNAFDGVSSAGAALGISEAEMNKK